MTRLIPAVAIIALMSGALIAGDVPVLLGPVNDEAKMLSAEQATQLRDALLAQESQTSNQIVILTVRSLGSDTIEGYAQKVFTTWKLGRVNKDNGVLILVSVDDHRMRIEVGKGLEGALTDAITSKIINDVMKPRFRNSDFAGGLTEAVNAINRAIQGEFTAEAEQQNTMPGWVAVLIILMIAVAIIIVLSRFRHGGFPEIVAGSGGMMNDIDGSGGNSGGFSGGGDSGGYSGGGGDSGGGGASGRW